MTIGLVGRKVGMTRIFTDDGGSLPVTVLDVSDNRVTQIKTPDRDGYSAVQVAFGKRRATRVSKPLAGHLAKAAVEAGHVLKEFRLARPEELGELKVGVKVGVESVFKVGQRVDVQGVTIGKGFAGVIKRHHFHSQRASHGNSISHKTPGSTGQNQSPGHVFPGKRMPGHLGNKRRTISNLVVVRIDAERQLLLIKGSVPGSNGRDVVVRPAVKLTKAAAPGARPQAAKPAAAAQAAKPAAAAGKPAAKPAAQPAKK
jgi:large subunit ribosomal protein L3